MSTKTNSQSESITGPLLDRIKARDMENLKKNFPEPAIGSTPQAEPDSYQDPGGGYNKNLTYPQK